MEEESVFGMFSQIGSLIQIAMPRDEETEAHHGYAFAEYEDEDAAEIAFKMMNFLLAFNKVRYEWSYLESE